jgi:hypothetical protein
MDKRGGDTKSRSMSAATRNGGEYRKFGEEVPKVNQKIQRKYVDERNPERLEKRTCEWYIESCSC